MLSGFRRWSTSSRWLGALFLMVLVSSATTLLWLGVQPLEEDRRLWADRDRERRESAADIIVRALEQKLEATAIGLVEGDLPDVGVFARFDGPTVTVRRGGGPGGRLTLRIRRAACRALEKTTPGQRRGKA